MTMNAVQSSLAEGRYELIEVIGTGGMAAVYRARDTTLDVYRAIKMLLPAMAKSNTVRQRFIREARAMAKLEHLNIVRIYDVRANGDGYFIVMELVEGGSLIEKMREQGALPARFCVDTCLAVLEALALAHSRSVVHRDIKPHNILFAADGTVKLTDFGIAQMEWDGQGLTRQNDKMGTEGFMAPEQKVSTAEVDLRADLYAVGATLFAALSGCEELPMLSSAELDQAMLDPIPEPFRAFVMKATAHHREKRYQSAQEMAAALREIRDSLPEDPVKEVHDDQVAQEPSSSGQTIVAPEDPEVIAAEFDAPRGGTIMPFDDRDKGEDLRPRSRKPWIILGVCIVALGALALGVSYLSGNTKTAEPELTLSQVAEQDAVELVPDLPVIVEPAVDSEPIGSTEGLVGLEVDNTVDVVEPKPVVEAPAPMVDPRVEEPVPEPVKVEPPKVEPPKPVVETREPAKVEPSRVDLPEDVTQTNSAPVLSHTAPERLALGADFVPEVRISGGDYKVTIYYRPRGSAKFESKRLALRGGIYSTSIILGPEYASGLEYSIAAESDNTELPKLTQGSGMRPLRVPVQ